MKLKTMIFGTAVGFLMSVSLMAAQAEENQGMTAEQEVRARQILWQAVSDMEGLKAPKPVHHEDITFANVSDPRRQLEILNTLYLNGMISIEVYHNERAQIINRM